MLGTLGAIAGGLTNLSDTAGNFESALKGFNNTDGNFFDKIKGGIDGVNDFQKGVGENVDLAETNEKLQNISNSLSNIENNNKSNMEDQNFNTAVGNAKTFAPAKELTAIETTQDPLTQRASDAKRYEKFNAIAMGGIGLRQDSPFKMGVETTEAKTGMSEEDIQAAKEEPTDENSEENNDKGSDKTKRKAAAAKGIADGLAAGFNAYASAIAQEKKEIEYDEKGYPINNNPTNVEDKPAAFTVEHRKGRNSGALISNETSGSIGADKDVLINNATGEEKTLKKVYRASF